MVITTVDVVPCTISRCVGLFSIRCWCCVFCLPLGEQRGCIVGLLPTPPFTLVAYLPADSYYNSPKLQHAGVPPPAHIPITAVVVGDASHHCPYASLPLQAGPVLFVVVAAVNQVVYLPALLWTVAVSRCHYYFAATLPLYQFSLPRVPRFCIPTHHWFQDLGLDILLPFTSMPVPCSSASLAVALYSSYFHCPYHRCCCLPGRTTSHHWYLPLPVLGPLTPGCKTFCVVLSGAACYSFPKFLPTNFLCFPSCHFWDCLYLPPATCASSPAADQVLFSLPVATIGLVSAF